MQRLPREETLARVDRVGCRSGDGLSKGSAWLNQFSSSSSSPKIWNASSSTEKASRGFILIVQMLVGLLSLSSPPASGTKTAGESACLRVCEEDSSTSGQRECLRREKDAAQKQLDAAVRAVEGSFSKDGKKTDPSIPDAFRKAQAAWATFYAADCYAVATTWTDGSGRRGAAEFCLLDHIRRRTRDLWFTYHLESAVAQPAVVCNDLRPDA